MCSYPSSSTDEQLLELNGNQPAVLEVDTFPFVLRLTQERCAYTNTAINNEQYDKYLKDMRSLFQTLDHFLWLFQRDSASKDEE